jgi:hypothetical protein
MADEVKAEADASDKDLSAESNTDAEEIVVDNPEKQDEPEVPAEPEDNSERSKLGRKVKNLELALEEALEKINKPVKQETGLDFGDEPKFEDDDEEISFRKGDMRKMIMDTLKVTLPKVIPGEVNRTLNVKDEYNRKAAITIGKLGTDIPDDIFEQIAQRVEKKFTRHTGVPEIDAKWNFMEAQVEILKVTSKKKVNPLEKNKDKKLENLGGGGGESAPNKKTVALSAEMKALQKKYNLSDAGLQRVAKQQGIK